MKESKVFLFMAFLTMLILFSIIPEVSFATKDYSERGKGKQNKYISEGACNLSNNNTGDAGDFAIDKERLQINSSVKDRNRTSDYKQEKNQIIEEAENGQVCSPARTVSFNCLACRIRLCRG